MTGPTSRDGAGGSTGGTGEGGPRRPLLAGGERLRERAERAPGGRAPRAPYDYVRARELLRPQLEALVGDVAAIPEERRVRHVIIEATVLPNYIAQSHFPSALLNRAEMYPVGTRQARSLYRTEHRERADEPTKTLLLAGPDRGVDALVDFLEREPAVLGVRLWDQLRSLERVGLSDPEVVVRFDPERYGDGEVITWEAVLSPVGRTPAERERWGDEAFDKWVAFVRALAGDVDVAYRRLVNDVTFVPISLHVEAAREAAAFNLLRVMRPMPRLRQLPPHSTVRRAAGVRPPAAAPIPAHSPDAVAIFDGGVDTTCPHFQPFVRAFDLTPAPIEPESLQHGSMVTSAFLYGHIDLDAAVLPRPVAPVDHYRVLPPPTAVHFDESLYWLLDQIRDTVVGHGYRRVNLSLGPNCAVEEDGEPHRWTAELDRLAAERGVLFVVAAGNNGEEDDDLGFNRVQVPADMANGVSVGACTNRGETRHLNRASYSAVGPGRPGQRLQPTGVCFGGDLRSTGFAALDQTGSLVFTQGTSFSAPLALRGICELVAGLGPGRADVPTLRAFATHFAARRPRGHKVRDLGHGRLPESYEAAWECAEHEVTLVYRDSLTRGESTAMRLPFPDGIAAGARVELAWTLSYLSDVDPADAAEYTRSGLEVVFRPHEGRRAVSDATTKERIGVFDITRQRDELAALAGARALKISDVPEAASNWRRFQPERLLRQAGKWETLSRGQIALSAAELFAPRIDLLHLARESGALLDQAPPLDVTLVVTLRAPVGVMLYDLAVRQFAVLTPLVQHADVRLRTSA